jgi:hypothetical protein
MPHPDGTGPGAVIAIKAAQECGFAGTGRPGQCHAFAGMHLHVDTAQHVDAHAALQVQQEVFGKALSFQHQCHADSTDETRSCV